MGIIGSIIGSAVGALVGNKFGISGFFGAINASVPGAITGGVVGGLLEDKITNSQKARFPLEGTPEPELNVEVRRIETIVIETVCKARLDRGLSVPKIDDGLSWIARHKSFDMKERNTIDFDNSTYGKFADMLNGFGYNFNEGGICVGDNFYGQWHYLSHWMGNSEIQEILFRENFVRIGVGYVQDGGYLSVILVR